MRKGAGQAHSVEGKECHHGCGHVEQLSVLIVQVSVLHIAKVNVVLGHSDLHMIATQSNAVSATFEMPNCMACMCWLGITSNMPRQSALQHMIAWCGCA